MFARKTKEALITYVILALCCIAAAWRDVGAEYLFKNYENLHPLFVLFLGCLLTQILMLVIMSIKRPKLVPIPKSSKKDIYALNVFTFLSFLTYFLAIKSPLGATVNSYIAFGVDPIITALLLAIQFKQKISRNFILSVIPCVVGIFLLGWSNIKGLNVSIKDWSIGFSFSVLSSLFYAYYIIYLKRILNIGIGPVVANFFRLTLTNIALGAFFILNPELVKDVNLLEVLGIGAVGFAMAFFIFTFLVQKTNIQQLVILAFLFPVFTNIVSAFSGLYKFSFLGLMGSILILSSMAIYEKVRRKPA